MHELKRSVESGNIFLGAKENLKNAKKIQRALVPSDCREGIVKMLTKNGVDVEIMEFSKKDIANKLELNFECEVFGLKR